MPATSRAQFIYMRMLQSGAIKRKGLSAKKAGEFTKGVDYASLPARTTAHARHIAAHKLRGTTTGSKPRRKFGVRSFRTSSY